MKYIIIKTTFEKIADAKNVANILLEKKLAACVQLSKVDSFYIWNEKTINSEEILMEIKSKASFYDEIEAQILKNHNYENPEILCLEIKNGSKAYFRWIDEVLQEK